MRTAHEILDHMSETIAALRALPAERLEAHVADDLHELDFGLTGVLDYARNQSNGIAEARPA